MMRSSTLSMLLVLCAAGAGSAKAQRVPMDWNNRTLTGASLEIMTVDGAGLLQATLRSTHIGNRTVAPDVSWGVGFVDGVLLSTIDLGIGTSVGTPGVLATISGGPTLLGAVAVGSGGSGAAAIVGVQARAGVVVPFNDKIGVRFDAGRRWYINNNQTYGVWTFGFGVTGFGRQATH